MGDEMSLNNFSWMGYNPDPMRTIGSNNWQWNMFGTYPNDSLSANNDYNQFKFDYNTSIFLDDTARMTAIMGPMVKMLQASIAEWSQKSLMNISSDYPDLTIRDRRTKSDKTDGTDGKSDKIDGTKVIKETEINTALNAMGTKDSRMGSKEITYIDKNGKEQKTKLLQRLIQLSKDYQDNPDNPEKIEISESNYKLLWDIAGKYAKTGELSREDYATLIDIAINPGGPGAYKKGGKEDEDKELIEKPNLSMITDEQIRPIVLDFKEAITGPGTDKKLLGNAVGAVNKDNILEVMDAYKQYIRANKPNEKQDLVEAILDDCALWGGGDTGLCDATFWGPGYNKLFRGKWFARQGDDAKPRLEIIQEALIKRANKFIKDNGEKKGITKEDIKNFTLPENEYNSWADKSRDDEGIKKSFKSFIEKLKEAEAATYKDNE